MKESPLYFLASKAKQSKARNLHHCILSRPARLHGARLKAFAAFGPFCPPVVQYQGILLSTFPKHPSQTSFISEELHKIMGSWTQVFHKSTETDIQKAIFFFYRCSKDQMTLDHFITCWNILGVIQGSRRSHPPKLTPLDMNIHC